MFGLGIWLPLLATFGASTSDRFNTYEKRKLADFPLLRFNEDGFNKFPTEFSKYFDDNFGMRGKLIYIHNYIKWAVLGVSPTQRAIVGKNGWLYLADGTIADYRNDQPFTEAELKLWRDVLVAKEIG